MASTPATRLDQLRACQLFDQLDDQALERVAATATELEAPARTVLVNPDLPASGVFILVEGTALVETHDRRRYELEPGECFGELAVLVGSPRTGRVSAKTEVRCLALDRGEFEQLLESEPAVTRALLHVLARRLVDAQSHH